MKINTQNTTPNNLWQARKRCGLERKQVAALLHQKSSDEIARYEKGINQPSLKNLLKLEIVYRTPVRLLFQELFEQSRLEISEVRKRNAHLLADNFWFPDAVERLKEEEFCFYERLLEDHFPSQIELEEVTRHIISLSNVVSHFRQKQNPFTPKY